MKSTDSRRRLLAALLASPLAGRALAQESSPVRIVGYLMVGEGHPRRLSAGLGELGYVEGRNLRFEIRRMPESAMPADREKAVAALAGSGAEVLVASGDWNVVALHRATTRIPIVSAGVSNPVSLGLARSLRNPGMNVTGLSSGLEEAAVLQFGALRLMRPRLKRVVFVAFHLEDELKVAPEHVSAAERLGIATDVAVAKDLEEVERIFAAIRETAVEAAWIDTPAAGVTAKQIAGSAVRHRLATHAIDASMVRDGLLFSFWLAQTDGAHRIAIIVDKILRGASPASIPFELPDKTELTINRATAAAIGVAIPEELKLRANAIVG